MLRFVSFRLISFILIWTAVVVSRLSADTDDLARVVFKAVTQYRSNKGKEKGLEELRLLLPQGSLLQAFVQSLQTLGEKENQSEQEQGAGFFSIFKTGRDTRLKGTKMPMIQ